MDVQSLCKGMPVLIMRRGVYPNREEVKDVMASWPDHVVRTEPVFQPTRFAITVQRKL